MSWGFFNSKTLDPYYYWSNHRSMRINPTASGIQFRPICRIDQCSSYSAGKYFFLTDTHFIFKTTYTYQC